MPKKRGSKTTRKAVKKTAKKITKKTTKKKKTTAKKKKPEQGVMAVIPYSEIAKPEMHQGKYNLTPTKFTKGQIEAIISRTPQRIISKRPGKGGGEWAYIPGWWFKKKLNFVFGFDGWDTIIDGERIDGDFITVKGRLVIKDSKTGKEIVSKQDYGGKEIAYKKGTKNFLDISNDFKAAQTDLIKRCCVQIGFAMDIYGAGEMIQEGVQVDPQNGNGQEKLEEKDNGKDRCRGCKEILTDQQLKYSMSVHKRPLCRECEKKAKK